jgi:NADH:ubiquinone oxidoreductase subunit E
MLIESLRQIQEEHGYLPSRELEALATRASVPRY